MDNEYLNLVAQANLPTDPTFSDMWIELIAYSLLHFLWQGLLVGLLSWSLLIMQRNKSPNSRYQIGFFSLVVLAILPVANGFYLSNHLGIASAESIFIADQQAAETVAEKNGDIALGASDSNSDEISFDQNRNDSAVFAADNDTETADGISNLYRLDLRSILEPAVPWIVAIWSTGVILLSFRFWLGFAGLSRLRKRLVNLENPDLKSTFDRMVQTMRVNKSTVLATSEFIQVPSVIGWFRPIVVLPLSAMSGLHSKEIESLLAHELAHVKRNDFLINLFQMIVENVLFFHPVIWWVSNRIRHERELCCDDEAIKQTGDPLGYAIALTNLTDVNLNHATKSLSFVAAAAGGDLKMRIQRILGLNGRRHFVSQWFAAVALLMVVPAFCVTFALASNSSDVNEIDYPFDNQAQRNSTEQLPAYVGISTNPQQDDNDTIDTSRVRGGLQMDLDVTKDPMSDEHEFTASIRNVTDKDITIQADFYYEQDANDNLETYIQSAITFSTYPKVLPSPYQTGGIARTSDQPTKVIKPGETFVTSWKSKSTFLTGSAHVFLPRQGVYSIRAELTLDIVGAEPVKLFSGVQKIQVGEKNIPPAACTGTIFHFFKEEGKVKLDIGSADGIKVGEIFAYQRSMFNRWEFEITQVDKGTSIAKYRYLNRKGEIVEPEEADFPDIGTEIGLANR